MPAYEMDDSRWNKRKTALLKHVTGSRKRATLLAFGRIAVQGFRENVLRERTWRGRSFKGTLAESTKQAIKQRQTSRTRGRARAGKKMRTVVGGRHIRRGGAHVLRDTGAMFSKIGTAAVSSKHVEVGMTTKHEAAKAAGHHWHIKAHKGPSYREFIGTSPSLLRKIDAELERRTVKAPGVR